MMQILMVDSQWEDNRDLTLLASLTAGVERLARRVAPA